MKVDMKEEERSTERGITSAKMRRLIESKPHFLLRWGTTLLVLATAVGILITIHFKPRLAQEIIELIIPWNQ